jgi:hypothetical protein
MIEVEIVGGPRDGEVHALPEGVNVVNLAMPTRIDRILMECDYPLPSRDPGYVQVSMPVKLTRNGYKAYWREPS